MSEDDERDRIWDGSGPLLVAVVVLGAVVGFVLLLQTGIRG